MKNGKWKEKISLKTKSKKKIWIKLSIICFNSGVAFNRTMDL